ncbi:hypothetical protein F5Y10DRAFT_191923 [Nemania abortiva]|nr:hypothetical protein F5Y10DRAFT_191923 [Nemania abortiva]
MYTIYQCVYGVHLVCNRHRNHTFSYLPNTYYIFHSSSGSKEASHPMRAIQPPPNGYYTAAFPPGANRGMQATNYIKSVTILGPLHPSTVTSSADGMG